MSEDDALKDWNDRGAESQDCEVSRFPETSSRVKQLTDALESIAAWRKVNISGEYEHGLRDIIRSITDCAAAALEASAPLQLNEHAECTLRICPTPDACFEMCKMHRKSSAHPPAQCNTPGEVG